MASSKQTYECFTCKNNGFAAVMVYLAGKDPQGRAIRLEDDGVTPHMHKTKVPSQQIQQHAVAGSTTVVSESTQLKVISARIEGLNNKVDRVIKLLEEKEHG